MEHVREERRKKNATGETVTDASGKMDAKDETDLHCFDILAGTGSEVSLPSLSPAPAPSGQNH